MLSFLSSAFKKHEKRILLRLANGETKTYGEIWNHAGLQAYAWRNMKIPEKTLLIQRPNSERWLVESLAAWRLGCQVIPLARHENVSEREKETDPGIISTETEFRIRKDTGFKSYPLVLFTSGSMGSGKKVSFSSENILTNLSQIDKVVGEDMVCEDDISFSMLPWSHSYGLNCELLFLISRGASLFLPDPSLSLDSQIRASKPTLLFTVPYFLEKALSFPDWFQYTRLTQYVFGGRLKSVSVGGAFCPPSLLNNFQNMFDVPVYQGYGMTETSPMISLNTSKDNKPGTAGKPLPGIDVRFGSDREILVAGKNVVSTLDPERYEYGEGKQWLKTGDTGHIDEEGYLVVEQRLGDIFKLSNGLFINASKIESLYAQELSAIIQLERFVLVPDPRSDNRCVLVGFLKKPSWLSFWSGSGEKIRFMNTILMSLGKQRGLLKHEIPTDVVWLEESQLKDFCTPKFTVRRHVLQDFVKDLLRPHYRQITNEKYMV